VTLSPEVVKLRRSRRFSTSQLTSKPPPIMQRLRSIFNRPAKGAPYGGRTLEYDWQAVGKLNWIGVANITLFRQTYLETVVHSKKAQKSPDRVKECIGHRAAWGSHSKIPPEASLSRFVKGHYSLATICGQRIPARIPLLLLAARKWMLARWHKFQTRAHDFGILDAHHFQSHFW
jgi:hypothetical protein